MANVLNLRVSPIVIVFCQKNLPKMIGLDTVGFWKSGFKFAIGLKGTHY